MDYRKVYMKIISNAIKDNRKKLKKGAENYVYYEEHHILPKSLFPAWKNRKSNLVLLTAREHFFCHQLLVKIYPCRSMNLALAAFLWGLKTSNNRGIQRVNKYKISSREYERIRAKLSMSLSEMQKTKWENKTQEELDDWKKKHSESLLNRTPEQRAKSLQKLRETLKNRTPEEWKLIAEKSKRTKQNKSPEELLEMHNRLSNNTKGKSWFNNGSKEILCFECPEGFKKGRIPNPEAAIKAGKTNKERNKTRAPLRERMTEEKYQNWIKKQRELRKDFGKIYNNLSDEAKKRRNEKISNSLKGHIISDEQRKRISEGICNSPKHKEAVEKIAAKHRGKHFFNNGEICILAETCPEGFVPGLIKKQGSRKNSKEK